jgi:hypothetical protein
MTSTPTGKFFHLSEGWWRGTRLKLFYLSRLRATGSASGILSLGERTFRSHY